jgi:hypothetical protein
MNREERTRENLLKKPPIGKRRKKFGFSSNEEINDIYDILLEEFEIDTKGKEESQLLREIKEKILSISSNEQEYYIIFYILSKFGDDALNIGLLKRFFHIKEDDEIKFQ